VFIRSTIAGLGASARNASGAHFSVLLGVIALGLTGCAHAPATRIISIQGPPKPVAELKDTRRFSARVAKRTMQVASLLPTAIPADWPKDLAYRPRRNFGPFYSGSDLLNIKVLVDAQVGDVYYGPFLVTHPDADIFKRYYGPTLPTADVSWSAVPGRFPPCDQNSPATANNILLALTRIRWTARYGGSIELLFESQEDFEGELCYQGVKWDLGSLQMRVYVSPNTLILNNAIRQPQGPNIAAGMVTGIELTTSNETAYDASGTVLRDPTASGSLALALANLSKSLLTPSNQHGLLLDATRFAYGFLNSQFKDDLGPYKVVDAIEISNDFLNLKTHTGKPYLALDVRIIILALDGAEDLGIEIPTFWDPNSYAYSSDLTIPSVSDGEGTGWITTMVLPLRVCSPSHQDAYFSFQVHSDDFSELYESKEYQLSVFNCSELQSLYAAAKFGVVHEWAVNPVGLNEFHTDTKEYEGWLGSLVELRLILQ